MNPLHNDPALAYAATLTQLLDQALETIRTLPPETQDAVARFLLQFAGDDEPAIQLTAEEEADLAAADEEIARGEFATDEEMQTIWAKRGL
jgi:hypothetical protein